MKSISTLLILFSLINGASSNMRDDIVILNENNFVTIRGSINGQTTSKVITQLTENSEKDLYVYLSTGGGSVTDGMQIVQTLLAIEKSGRNVHCIGNVALSMGFVIMQFCQNRYVLESSVLMQHQMYLGNEGQLMNMKSYMNFIESMDESIDLKQASRMNMTLLDFRNKVNHDWWFFGNDSVKHNAADKLVYVLCDFKGGVEIEFVRTFFGPVQVTFSKCPLARHPLKIEFNKPELNTIDNIMNVTQEIYAKYDLTGYIRDRMSGDNKLPTYTL